MSAFPPDLQAFLDTGVTTLSYCWRLTRNDGIVQGFTEHDLPLTFDGTTFEAESGFTASAIESELGLSVDNLNADGALSADTINEEDLAAGRYDGASVELFWVNFENTDQRFLMMKGSIGEVRRFQTQFSAELRSQSHFLQQQTGRTYQRYCDADLGDERCTVNLGSAAFSGVGVIDVPQNRRVMTVSAVSGNNTEGFYALGKMTFTSGLNSGLTFEVKIHSPTGAGTANIEFWSETPFDIAAADAFSIVAGCAKDCDTCRLKFNNIVNFQGFQFIPGNDHITRFPTRGGSDQDGGSVFA